MGDHRRPAPWLLQPALTRAPGLWRGAEFCSIAWAGFGTRLLDPLKFTAIDVRQNGSVGPTDWRPCAQIGTGLFLPQGSGSSSNYSVLDLSRTLDLGLFGGTISWICAYYTHETWEEFQTATLWRSGANADGNSYVQVRSGGDRYGLNIDGSTVFQLDQSLPFADPGLNILSFSATSDDRAIAWLNGNEIFNGTHTVTFPASGIDIDSLYNNANLTKLPDFSHFQHFFSREWWTSDIHAELHRRPFVMFEQRPRQVIGFRPSAPSGITGSGAIIADPAIMAGSGVQSTAATGAIIADPAVQAGIGAQEVTGTGAQLAGVALMEGYGLEGEEVTGTGAIVADPVVMAGTGTQATTGPGSILATPALQDGAAAQLTTGTGAIASAPAVQAGTGEQQTEGTGAQVAQTATMAGTGGPAVSGIGATSAGLAVMAGAGDQGAAFLGTGAILAGEALQDGAGTQATTGTGAQLVESALMNGAGEQGGPITGTGAQVAGPVTMAGTGMQATSGAGMMTAFQAVMSGAGQIIVTGPGSIGAQPAVMDGAGGQGISGSGDMVAQPATMAGPGIQATVGSGNVMAGMAQMEGFESPGYTRTIRQTANMVTTVRMTASMRRTLKMEAR